EVAGGVGVFSSERGEHRGGQAGRCGGSPQRLLQGGAVVATADAKPGADQPPRDRAGGEVMDDDYTSPSCCRRGDHNRQANRAANARSRTVNRGSQRRIGGASGNGAAGGGRALPLGGRGARPAAGKPTPVWWGSEGRPHPGLA